MCVRLCSFASMVGIKLYLFVILLLGILLVEIRLSTLHLFIVYFISSFVMYLDKLFFHFYWFSQIKKEEFLMYDYYVYNL